MSKTGNRTYMEDTQSRDFEVTTAQQGSRERMIYVAFLKVKAFIRCI